MSRSIRNHVLEEARRRAAAAACADDLERIQSAHRWFQTMLDLERHGVGTAWAQLDAAQQATPPTPPNLRGRLGARMIRLQRRLLWWIPWSIESRDVVLRACLETIERQHWEIQALRAEKSTDIERLEERLRRLEQDLEARRVIPR